MELPGGNKTRKRGRKKEGEKRDEKVGGKKKKGNGDGSNEFCDRIREGSA